MSQIDRLTPRERQVFDHVIHGDGDKVIAHQLGIALSTVHVHRRNIRMKLDGRTAVELRALAETEGVTPTPGPCHP